MGDVATPAIFLLIIFVAVGLVIGGMWGGVAGFLVWWIFLLLIAHRVRTLTRRWDDEERGLRR